MAKELKQLVVAELIERYTGMDRCVVVGFKGISSEADVEIRNTLREAGISLNVVKNSLVAQAFKNVGLEDLVGILEGSCAIATGGSDVVELAKVVNEVSIKTKILEIKGGYAERQTLQAADVKRLAQIPPKPVLLANLLYAAKYPVTRMVGTLSAFTRGFVIACDAIARKKGDGSE